MSEGETGGNFNKKESLQKQGDNPQLIEKTDAPRVLHEVLAEINHTLNNFDTEKIEANRVAVVLSAYDANNLLPTTLKEITEQLRQSGLYGEIFIILNNGGGNTREFIRSGLESEQLEFIKKKIGVNDIIFGKTQNLSESSQSLKSIPREIELERDITDVDQETKSIRLVVIEQQSEPDNAGKIRGLRDVYEFLKKQNQKNKYCPQYLLAIDAETRIRPIENGKVNTESNTGLAHMIELSDGGKKMVGAKLHFVPYDDNGNPDWKKKTPPMQKTVSILHGMKGYEWLPGGATLGGFPEMVSILNVISRKLPGTRIEDVLTTVLARALNIETIVDYQVVHVNRCPSEAEKEKAFEQMVRWLKGAEGLINIVGDKLAKEVIDNQLFRIIAYPLIELAKGGEINIIYLLKGLLPYLKAWELAKENPDDFLGGEATF